MAARPAILTPPSERAADLQNVTLFRIYVFYRSLLSIVLLLSLVSADSRQLLGVLNPTLYLYVASGLPILLVVTAAAGAVLINNRTIATLVAALSVIALLSDSLRLINEQLLPMHSLVPAGLLGVLIFAVSILIQMVTSRVNTAEELARKRANDLYNLQRLNEQIVQHLQTGILLVYANGSVRIMNQAATRLLDPQRPVPLEQGRALTDYHHELAEQYRQWCRYGTHLPTPIRISDEAPAIVAHEIRNPLGAVSHAAQLLSESEQLTEQATIELELAEDVADVEFDPEHLRRVLSNLLDNGLGLYMCKELCEINNATLAYRLDAADRSCFRIAIVCRN